MARGNIESNIRSGPTTGRNPSVARRHGPLGSVSDSTEEEAPLNEDVDPEKYEEAPAYEIQPLIPWHPDRVRMWIALTAMIMFGLGLVGQFVLIMSQATNEQLLAWQGGLGTVGTLTAGIVAYYFSKRNT